MTPFQRKIRSLGKGGYIASEIKDLPQKLDKAVLEELVTELRKPLFSLDRKREIRNKIVNGHMRLGMYIAARYAFKYKSKSPGDIIGEMSLALIEAVDRAAYKLTDNNITPFISSAIHSALMTFIEEDRIVKVPGRSIRHYNKINFIKLDKFPRQIEMIDQGYNSEDELLSSEYVVIPQTEDDHSVMEIQEILDQVTFNVTEKKIVELRAEGCTFEEIGPKVGYGKSYIETILLDIKNRFNKKLA